jgi:hypothetical protein
MDFCVYLNGKKQQDRWLEAFARSANAKIREQGNTLIGGVTVVAGLEFDSLSKIKQCRREGKPFIFMDHAYFNRGYDTGNMRVCVGGVHQTTLWSVPEDRKKSCGVVEQPWRFGAEVFVIAPSERVCEALGASKRWATETAKELRKYTSRSIRIKVKGDGLKYENAHCAVSLSSAADVEAAVLGVPVFATEHSPAAPIAQKDFSRIETPIYPDRTQWLSTLAYSQWNVGELADGTTKRHLERVLDGDLKLCRASNGGQ